MCGPEVPALKLRDQEVCSCVPFMVHYLQVIASRWVDHMQLNVCKRMYHEFVENQGDEFEDANLCIAFNSGAFIYTWARTLKLLVERKLPTLLTAYNREEAEGDAANLPKILWEPKSRLTTRNDDMLFSAIQKAFFFLVLASLAPEVSAVIIVYHSGSGLSDNARIAIIVVCVVLFVLLLACRVARIRQNRRALAARVAQPVIPVSTVQIPPNVPNYASQGPGGYNGYTLPPTQYLQGYGRPPQDYQPGNVYTPPAYGPGVDGVNAEKNDFALPAAGPTNTDANANQHYAPPPGPPNGYYPPVGYDVVISPPPAARTTGQDLSVAHK
ncbi:hypothetical protein B0H16DRAFT_1786749 [Mycena metata]|uniref:Mitochondrial splicing suppressor 51-like C-terminal domain-containing protein n=1 Tax=Mycena metata TaxID=1033252 RepID=A0AAD7HNB4_9AGAR|nr:hypothetical protein B0H16DRAFT_1786749 [Mycena metata]